MRPVRVLTIDGGGMRGLYAATYLSALAVEAAKRRKSGSLDVGRAFDLIVGTSTGGIIACALAAGVPLAEVASLYRCHGKAIFPVKMPSGVLHSISQMCSRPKHLANGSAALERALEGVFARWTIREIYDRRGIALAIPAVDMTRHRAWVFKTPHLNGHRDDGFRLVDVCLATSAAPLYRSLARVAHPTDSAHHYVFVDGGLWANNPVLVGMIDGLRMTEPGNRIEIFSLGTCPRPPGDVSPLNMHWGFSEWEFGGRVASVSLAAQESAYDEMASMFALYVDRDCHVVRFPRGVVPAEAMRYLDLDETSDEGMRVLTAQAHADVSLALSAWDRPSSDDERRLAALMMDVPPAGEREA